MTVRDYVKQIDELCASTSPTTRAGHRVLELYRETGVHCVHSKHAMSTEVALVRRLCLAVEDPGIHELTPDSIAAALQATPQANAYHRRQARLVTVRLGWILQDQGIAEPTRLRWAKQSVEEMLRAAEPETSDRLACWVEYRRGLGISWTTLANELPLLVEFERKRWDEPAPPADQLPHVHVRRITRRVVECGCPPRFVKPAGCSCCGATPEDAATRITPAPSQQLRIENLIRRYIRVTA